MATKIVRLHRIFGRKKPRVAFTHGRSSKAVGYARLILDYRVCRLNTKDYGDLRRMHRAGVYPQLRAGTLNVSVEIIARGEMMGRFLQRSPGVSFRYAPAALCIGGFDGGSGVRPWAAMNSASSPAFSGISVMRALLSTTF